MSHHTFATVANCIDGRTQKAAQDWARDYFGVQFVDSVNRPGMDRVMAEEEDIGAIYNEVEVSRRHGSRKLAVVGHYDCAGNPVDEANHRVHIRQAALRFQERFPDMHIVGIWIGETWTVDPNPVCELFPTD